MRTVICGLVVAAVVSSASVAVARCGDQRGDDQALDSAVGAIVRQCGCCRTRPPLLRHPTSCAVDVVGAAVDSGALPRRCARTAIRRARRVCRRLGVPCRPPATTTTLPRPTCTGDGQCDDGNACTADSCVDGRCRHACRCVSPRGGQSCCPGPAAQCQGLHWFYSCGYPVCRVDGNDAIPGVPACTTQQVGAACAVRDAECNPGAGCGVRLVCTDRDPRTRGCPISLRSAKRDVSYLGSDEVGRLHDDLMRLKLATYAYRSDGPAARRRLGFVIDDVGQSPAIAPGGDMVDLYGYASMAVAAIQAQDREIGRLRDEIAALRRECRAPAKRR